MSFRALAEEIRAAKEAKLPLLPDFGDVGYWDFRYVARRETFEWVCRLEELGTLISQMGENVESVLELGCGSSKLAEALVERGYYVTALDFSAEVIALRKREAAKHGEKLRFVCGDVTDLSVLRGETFDAVVMKSLLDSLSTRSDASRAVRAMLEGAESTLRRPGQHMVFWDLDDHWEFISRLLNSSRSSLECICQTEQQGELGEKVFQITLKSCHEAKQTEAQVDAPAWCLQTYFAGTVAEIFLHDAQSIRDIEMESSATSLRVRTARNKHWLVVAVPQGSVPAELGKWRSKEQMLSVAFSLLSSESIL